MHKCANKKKLGLRITKHPILGKAKRRKMVSIEVDGRYIPAYEGESIAAALVAAGIKVFRRTTKRSEPRGIFCAAGRCTDCMMIVNGQPNVRTCVTSVQEGIRVKTQKGLESWRTSNRSGGKQREG